MIEVDTKVLLENQPESNEEADELCNTVLIPMIHKLRLMCKEKGYEQVCTIDLKGIDITLLYPTILVRIIWNIYDFSKDDPEDLIKGFYITNSNKMFTALYKGSRYLLPKYLKDLITIS
jgi:hypothetical protein